eukprot:1514636-Pyramimonas_sp.AAC.1
MVPAGRTRFLNHARDGGGGGDPLAGAALLAQQSRCQVASETLVAQATEEMRKKWRLTQLRPVLLLSFCFVPSCPVVLSPPFPFPVLPSC